MALVLGTNCGFCSSAPADDPDASNSTTADTKCNAIYHTSPATAAKITEIGWYTATATQEANFELGIYDDDGNSEPELRVEVDDTNAKGTDAGWKRVAVDWDIDASTVYWIALQLDDTATTTKLDYTDGGASILAWKYTQSTLPADWGTSDGSIAALAALYVVWEAAAAAVNAKVNVGDSWKSVNAAKINIGDTWKDVASIKVNVGDSWKTVTVT